MTSVLRGQLSIFPSILVASSLVHDAHNQRPEIGAAASSRSEQGVAFVDSSTPSRPTIWCLRELAMNGRRVLNLPIQGAAVVCGLIARYTPASEGRVTACVPSR